MRILRWVAGGGNLDVSVTSDLRVGDVSSRRNARIFCPKMLPHCEKSRVAVGVLIFLLLYDFLGGRSVWFLFVGGF